ncbi:MAG TPA: CorA family divalent cation transporter [Gammaproteobacteria bacterium]|nr:CorA family divalent cation transporter [Gammaproteobacteria bacterium]
MVLQFAVDANGILKEDKKNLEDPLWIDVCQPTSQDRIDLLEKLQVILPMHHELHQLEYSNRFYEEENNIYFSVNVITKALPIPESHVMTFILTKNTLVTLRYADPHPIRTFIDQLEKRSIHIQNPLDIFYILVEACVGRIADMFEVFDEKTNQLAQHLSSIIKRTTKIKRNEALNQTLGEINDLENLLSKCFQSLSSLQFLIGFLKQVAPKIKLKIANGWPILNQDLQAMIDHGEYLTDKLSFLLESTLGLINIEQTNIIKSFTVLAMIFMPPTLIASVYGMNFRYMPEINLVWGYPFAMGVMIISAILPTVFFKLKGWI